jgi:hypothetical protein
MSVPPEVLERLVFSTGEQDYRWADVLAAARAWDQWDEIERRAALRPSPASDEDVEQAGQAFRYDRNLLAAEEMEAWLEHWSLTVADWTSWLRGEPDVWSEAVCSGALAELARDLAARTAAAEANGGAAGPVETNLEEMDEALSELTRRALANEDRGRLLELRGPDWVRVVYSALAFAQPSMAREAAMCVREDGLNLAEVATRAGVELQRVDALVADIDSSLAKPLLSTPAGELAGPLEAGDEFVLLQLHEKIAPTLADPVIQGLLEREVPRRAVEREVRNRVRWHERL